MRNLGAEWVRGGALERISSLLYNDKYTRPGGVTRPFYEAGGFGVIKSASGLNAPEKRLLVTGGDVCK